jgi:AhpD family alkylhydroperoxidase
MSSGGARPAGGNSVMSTLHFPAASATLLLCWRGVRVQPSLIGGESARTSEGLMYDMKNMAQLQKLGGVAPEALKSLVVFDETVFKDGVIPLKYKELMAVAVALATQCPYCIEIHSKKARKAGATEQELAETTLIAAALRAGGAITHGTHTLE